MSANRAIELRVLLHGTAGALLLFGVASAQADDFTIGGAFNNPNDVGLIEFSHSGGLFAAFTSQWLDAEPPIAGFDPILTLFDGTGLNAPFIFENDDFCFTGLCDAVVGGTTFTGGTFDSLLFAFLDDGDHTLTLTSFPNFHLTAGTLGDGFGSQATDFAAGPNFRVQLFNVDEILRVRTQQSVTRSGPTNDLNS